MDLGSINLVWIQQKNTFNCVHTRAVESEGFSTWGVGVAENFNHSDSGQTFCSPVVTVCATNVCKRHTWQFKQLDASTRDDHVYSDRRQRTNLHTFNQGPFQISSVTWAHHATYTLWMQPFGACITEISICSFWLALSLLRDVGYATMNERLRVLMGTRPLLHNARHRTVPVNPPRLGLIHISPSCQTVIVRLNIIWNGYCLLDWNSNPMFYTKPLLQKNIKSDIN